MFLPKFQIHCHLLFGSRVKLSWVKTSNSFLFKLESSPCVSYVGILKIIARNMKSGFIIAFFLIKQSVSTQYWAFPNIELLAILKSHNWSTLKNLKMMAWGRRNVVLWYRSFLFLTVYLKLLLLVLVISFSQRKLHKLLLKVLETEEVYVDKSAITRSYLNSLFG